MLDFQLSFITGQSDPRGNALSPRQNAFLDQLPAPEENKLRLNFPWRENTPEWRDTPLIPASYHNFSQFCRAQFPAFARRHRGDLDAWAAKAEKHLVFAGSCGLELLCRLAPPAELWNKIHVFAYGPCVFKMPPCRVFTVQGRQDWISRPYLSKPDVKVAANHLDYLEDAEVVALARRFVMDTLGEPPG